MADETIDLASLRLYVADRVKPFFSKVIESKKDDILALHVIGSALTDDFDPERSDVNSLVVLKQMDLNFLDLVASFCRQDPKLAAPMLMTPNYIERWRDVSPIELLDLKLVNKLVYGTDIISSIEIDPAAVILQCKRELRNRLIRLSWGYVRAEGHKAGLSELLQDSVAGLAPIMRGIIYARGEQPPLTIAPLFDALASFVGTTQALSFKEVYWMRLREIKIPVSQVRAILKDYYRAIEALIDGVDRIGS